MRPHDDNLIWEALREGGQRPPQGDKRLTGHHEAAGGDDAIRLKMAVAEVADALGSGRISLKSYDRDAGTLIVSTGGDKSIILKAVGFEGDHDIPISQRPDPGPRERSRDEMSHGQTPSRFGPTGDDARDFD